jgi:hypothetical protein
MTAENFDNALRALRDAQPFRLFTVELKSGLRFEVDSPGGLVFRDGVAVFVAPGGLPILFDHETVSHLFPAKSDTNLMPE